MKTLGDWQPIDTAPKDGTDVLLGFADHYRPPVVAGWFGDDGWEEYDSINVVKGKPTHWMPLPPKPKS
jgi:hypothetical protein